MSYVDMYGMVLQVTQQAQRQEATHENSSNLYRALASLASLACLWYRAWKIIQSAHRDIDKQGKAGMNDRFLGSSWSSTIAQLLEDFFAEEHKN